MAWLHGSLKFAAKLPICCQTFGGRSAKLLSYLVGLIGIEPVTSSMP